MPKGTLQKMQDLFIYLLVHKHELVSLLVGGWERKREEGGP